MGSVNKGTEPLYILRMPIPGSAGMGKLIEIILGTLRQPFASQSASLVISSADHTRSPTRIIASPRAGPRCRGGRHTGALSKGRL